MAGIGKGNHVAKTGSEIVQYLKYLADRTIKWRQKFYIFMNF